MKDEEMAEQFADNISGLELTCSLLSAKDKSHAYRLGRYEGFLAGLKVGRPQWHDLRKDPNDLPKEVGNYIVCYLDTACERHTFELSFVDYFEDKHWIDEDNHNIEGYDEGVIAWCEIPTFDKE